MRTRQLVTDRGEDGFGVAAFQSREEQERFPVRSQVKEVLRRDLPRHDGLGDSRVAKAGDQFSQLANAHPMDFIHFVREANVGFVRKRRRDNPFHAGAPAPLFAVHPGGGSVYDVAADGKRFLVNSLPADQGSPPLSLIIHWTSLLKP